MKVKVAQSCPTLCYPTDYTVHGILQARILERVAFLFSRGSTQPRDGTQVSHIPGGFFLFVCCCLVTKYVQLFCNPMHCSLPGLYVHGTSQARILEWVAISFSTRSSQPRDQSCLSCISALAVRFFSAEAPGKPNVREIRGCF